MAEQVQSMLLISIVSHVASEWIELPTVNPTNKYPPAVRFIDAVKYRSSIQKPDTTPINTMSPTLLSGVFEPEPTGNMTTSLRYGLKHQDTDKQVSEDDSTRIPQPLNQFLYETSPDKSDEEQSKVVKETLQSVENDLLHEPHQNIREKLDYLKTLQNILYTEIRRYSRGVWGARQARTKKGVMGFGTVEGALMTIAFLTFSVFLIKIVFQFIRSLHNEELMLLTLAPTLSSSRRSRREDKTFAAAQLLQYMDEFSIKHRGECDSP